MAIRQYVGARYVTKFYQNSQNPTSSEWENGVAYEAMTVVTYNNSSYTSKIPVPAGIGNPASNPTYWVATGAYNAQVEQYRQEVGTAVSTVNENLNQTTTKLEGDIDTLKNNVDNSLQQVQEQANEIQSNLTQETAGRKNADTELTNIINTKAASLKNKRFILVGDSYGADSAHGGLAYKTWVDYFKDALGLDDNSCYLACYGGTGFAGHFGGYTYLSYLQTISANISNPETITDIVVMGGMNDASCSNEEIENGIKEFITYCKTTFPNAEITAGMIGFSATIDGDSRKRLFNLYVTVTRAYQKIATYGGRYVRISGALAYSSDLTSDNIHPTEEAEKILGNAIVTAYLTGCADVLRYGAPTFTPATGYTSASGLLSDCKYGIMNRIATQGKGIQVDLGGDVTIPNAGLILGTVNNSCLNAITEVKYNAYAAYANSSIAGTIGYALFPVSFINNTITVYKGTVDTINSIQLLGLVLQNFDGQ